MSDPSRIHRPGELLRSALDAMGLAYRVEPFGPRLHARFRVGHTMQNLIRFDAVITDRVLRLTVMELMAADFKESTMWQLNELNRSWNFGRVYLNEVRGFAEASLGLYMGQTVPHPSLIRVALHHLVYAANVLRRLETPSFLMPANGRRWNLADLADLLTAKGHKYRWDRTGPLSLGVQAAGGTDFIVQFTVLVAGLLLVRAHPAVRRSLHVDRDLWLTLSRLNTDLPLGMFGLLRDKGLPYFQVGLPIDWMPLSTEMLDFALNRAESAVRELVASI